MVETDSHLKLLPTSILNKIFSLELIQLGGLTTHPCSLHIDAAYRNL
jgi:hypothetical protein